MYIEYLKFNKKITVTVKECQEGYLLIEAIVNEAEKMLKIKLN